MNGKLVSQNKKARHDYFFEEIIETGVVLTGTEIKSARSGGLSLRDSFAKIDGSGELWVYNMQISSYEQGNRFNSEPLRPKKLLAHRQEIRRLQSKVMQDGFSLIPVQAYINPDGRLKLDLALAKGKKLYDKRETVAARDSKRRMDKEIKNRLR